MSVNYVSLNNLKISENLLSFVNEELLKDLAPTVYNITLDECVAKGIVAPYTIYCKPVQLTPTEKDNYKKINNSFVYYKYQLGQFNAFDEAKRIMGDKNAHPADKKCAVMFYRAIRERKKIVDFAANKVTEFQKLVLTNVHNKILRNSRNVQKLMIRF